MKSKEIIYFSFGFKKGKGNSQTAFLSNFFQSPFEKNGVFFPTVEHFFQSEKFTEIETKNLVISADSPALAKKLGKSYAINIDEWEQRRDQVMMTGLELKFTQNEDLRQMLLATGDSKLVEDSKSDKYWGGTGHNSKNTLGKMLMRLRQSLQNPPL